MLDRWVRAVVRWRVVVVGLWVAVLIGGLVASTRLPALLSTSLSVPDSQSAAANLILEHHFDENIEGTFTVVVPLRHATKARLAVIEREVATAATSVPGAHVTQSKAAFGLLYENLDTPLALGKAADETATLRHALSATGLASALVTGPPALQSDLTPILTHDLHRGEAIALALALVLLLVALGWCWAVAIPFCVAAATVGASLGAVYLLAQHVLMVLYVPNVVELIGLGLSIDYSLLVVHRFRAELGREADVDAAVVATIATAGRTVLVSGVAVAVGLGTLLVVPVPFVRSLGAAGLLVPLAALATTFGLLPALLSFLGRRGAAPARLSGLLGRNALQGTWAHVARGVVRRPWTVLGVALALLLAAGTCALWLEVTPGSVTAIPQGVPSAKALTLVRDTVGPGVITPTVIVVDSGRAGGSRTSRMAKDRLALAEAILRDPEVAIVAIGHSWPYVDPTGRYAQILVISRHDFGDEATQQLVRHLRTAVIPSVRFPAGTSIDVGGAPAQGVDFLDHVYRVFPWVVLAALALCYLVLARAFRSLIVPLVAILLDLLSVGVAYGLMVAVFRFGVGSSVLGTYRVGQIEGWVPVFVFAVLFGLSSDYEVFIVARMREAVDAGAAHSRAVTAGLAQTGGVVSAAAVIMVGALAGLVFGHVAGLQELGVGLALGVLVDATIVRGLILPSSLALLGRRCWWLPAGAARLLMTKASPLEGARPSASESVT